MLQLALGLRQRIGNWLNGRKNMPSPGFSGPMAEKKSVLIVCDIENEQDRQSMTLMKAAMVRLCPKASINIACCYNKGSESAYNAISDVDIKYFSESQFSFFFKFKDLELRNFLQQRRDIAVFLIKSGNVVADFASYYVCADLKVGLAGTELDSNGFLNLCVSEGAKKNGVATDVEETLKMLFA